MEALLIHDPTADKVSASMTVAVGHLSDPDSLPGLAHFCEHLMFMGTEKYPVENEYTEFLTRNAGYSNAFTDLDTTCYYFDVRPEALSGALDRFAQFFIAPLFDASCSEREANAVHSENSKNLQADMWRLFQLEKELSNPKHPYTKFGTGNRKTLYDDPLARGEDVRASLIAWQKQHYSANLMKLAVLSRDSLDAMTATVVDMFSPAPNRHLPLPAESRDSAELPISEGQVRQTVFAKTLKDMRSLELTFPIEELYPHYEKSPESFISHLIGHEGKGSALSYLKGRGWANSLSAGVGHSALGFEFYKVHVDLTAEGLVHYEDVLVAVFKYMELVAREPLPEWLFHEVRNLAEMSFRFKEKGTPSSTTMSLSGAMTKHLPREKLLSADYLFSEWSPELIQRMLRALRPDNCRVTLATSSEVGGRVYDRTEPWYGTQYTVEPTSAKVLAAGDSSDIPELALPQRNSFVPTDLSLKAFVKALTPAEVAASASPASAASLPRVAPAPTLLQNTPTLRLWHKKDDRWGVPRVGLFLFLRSPLIDASATSIVKAKLFAELVKDALTEYTYDADLAGLSYALETHTDGFLLSLDGYSQKAPALASVVLRQMAQFEASPARLALIVDQIRRKLTNFALEQPYAHALQAMGHAVQEVSYMPDVQLAALDEVAGQSTESQVSPSAAGESLAASAAGQSATPAEAITAFAKDLLSTIKLEVLVTGNVLKDEAIALAEDAQAILGLGTEQSAANSTEQSAANSTEQSSAVTVPRSHRRSRIPPSGRAVIRATIPTPDNANSAIEQFTYVGDSADVATRARLLLLSLMMEEPAYDQLRSKEQLGYIVTTGIRRGVGLLGLRAIIQGEYDAAYLEGRLDHFVSTQFADQIAHLSDDEFEKFRNSAIASLEEDHKNLWQEASFYWHCIQSGYYDFAQRVTDAAAVKALTKSDVQSFFKQHFVDNVKRVTTQYSSQKLGSANFAGIVARLRELGAARVPEDLASVRAFSESMPTAAEAKAFLADFLAQKGIDQAQITAFADDFDALATPPLSPGARVVDPEEYRDHIATLGPYATPVAGCPELARPKM